MSRSDIRGQVVSIVFSAISTPRRIRATDPNYQTPQQWDYIYASFRGDPGQKVFIGINSATASSTVSTTASLTGALLTNKQVFCIPTQYLPLDLWTKATSLSIQATGSTAVLVSLVLGKL